MPSNPTLHIRQQPEKDGQHLIRLSLKRPGQPEIEAEANIEFALSPQEQEEIRWYMEDYLLRAAAAAPEHVAQVETLLQTRGEELYTKVLAATMDTQAIWFAIRPQLADLRVEVATGVAEAASIPWELMRDPQSDSAIAVRVHAFVRVQSNPNLDFTPVPAPAADADGRLRLLTSSPDPAAPATYRCGRWPIACCKTWAPTWPGSTSPPCARPPSSNCKPP